MASNPNDEYKIFKYYEGLCSSSDFPKEIAKVLSLGVCTEEIKDIDAYGMKQAIDAVSSFWDLFN